MGTLYIVGNGFDISHGLASKYSDFGVYIENNKPNIYESVDKYLNISSDWSDFEEALEYLDTDYIFDEASEYFVSYGAEDWSDSFHHSFQEYINDTVKSLSEDLYESFSTWISRVDDDISVDTTKYLDINKDSIFLSFNYTSTLEKVYEIENVNHIHGVIGDAKLALGHAWNNIKPIRYSEEDDNRIIEGIGIINSYFGNTFKNSSFIISENKKFFQDLKNVNKIVTLGHSLGMVDKPYFEKIKESVKESAVWYCSYYGEDDLINKRKALENLGIRDTVLDSIDVIAKKGFA